jgi:GcrA cell cycle regulator
MAWNDERVELLKKLWAEGLSASQIAGRLGNVTRNAVIGKVHRLGLSGRATTSRMKSMRPRPRANAVPNNTALAKRNGKSRFGASGNSAVRALYQPDAEPYVSPVEELVIPMAERKSIQTLTECSCRWPIGDPQLADFHFCGKDKVMGLTANSTPAGPSSRRSRAAVIASTPSFSQLLLPPRRKMPTLDLLSNDRG